MKTYILPLLLCIALLFCTGCAAETILLSSSDYLTAINDLASSDFGLLTVSDTPDAVTDVIQISDRLSLRMVADPVTGYVRCAELLLQFDPDMTDLDYASFSYFFLIMLKAYDDAITIGNINAIHDALEIETYTAGIDHMIGYGSCNYYYQVTEETALFSADFIVTKESVE